MKEYPTAAVLSLTTGVLLCEFSAMHELAEYLTGGPVWTHQFAHAPFNDEMREAIFAQHPGLSDVDASDVGGANWKSFVERCEEYFGSTLLIRPMEAEPHTRGESFTEPLTLLGSGRRDNKPAGQPRRQTR